MELMKDLKWVYGLKKIKNGTDVGMKWVRIEKDKE